MDKTTIVRMLIEKLEADLGKATDAAIESAESATHEESRSEGKYDTRGLETSYLATGQARHAIELRESLAAIQNFTPHAFSSDSPIALGALITLLSSSGKDLYFLAPGIGGLELCDDSGSTITVITSKSPIGAELIGKQTGDRIQAGGGKTIISVS